MDTPLPFVKCLSPVQVSTSKGVTLVPCGHCPACEARRKSDLQLRIQIEAKKHKHNWFITLTYDDEHLPIFTPYVADESYYSDEDFASGDIRTGSKIHDNVEYIHVPAVIPNKGFWLSNQDRIRCDGFANFNDSYAFVENGLQLFGHSFEHPYGSDCYAKGTILGMLYDYHRYLGKAKQAAFTLNYRARVTSWYSQVHSPINSVSLLFYKDVQNFMKRFRKFITKYIGKNEKIRYYIISEYGTRSLRPHFHIVLHSDSDKLAEYMRDTSFEVKPLATRDRQFYSNRAVSSCWSFGYCTIDKADDKVAGYVSNYVVGSSKLPRLLRQLAPQKTFHSVNYGIPFTKEESIQMLRSRDFQRFSEFEYVDEADGNRVKSRSLWRSYYNQFFPTFVGINSLSDVELLQVFKVYPKLVGYYFEDNVEKIARKIAHSVCMHDRGLGDSSDDNIALFFDWFKLSSATSVSLSPLKQILYASKRAIHISSWLGITLSDYVKLYRDFRNWLDYKCLAQHYVNMSNNHYRNLYENIYYGALEFGENLFDRYKYSYLFNYFKRDTEWLADTRLKHKSIYEQIKNI